MKSVIRPKSWLSLFLLIVLASYSAAQERQSQAVQPEMKLPALLSAKLLKEDPNDDELRKLLKARYNEVVSELKWLNQMYTTGKATINIYVEPGQRLVQAGLELYDKSAEKVALLTQYVELTKEIEKDAKARHDAGAVGSSELHRARYGRLDAEIRLLRAKREAEGPNGK